MTKTGREVLKELEKLEPVDISKYKIEELPLLSIGEMIEFLGDKSYDILNKTSYPDYKDTLWKACKEVLNGK